MNSSSLSGVFWSTLTIKSNSNLVELHILQTLLKNTPFKKRSPHLLRFCHDGGEEDLQRPSWLQVPIKPRLAVLQHAPITPSYYFPHLLAAARACALAPITSRAMHSPHQHLPPFIAWSDSHWSDQFSVMINMHQSPSLPFVSPCPYLSMPASQYESHARVRSVQCTSHSPCPSLTHMYHLIKSDHLLTTTWSPPTAVSPGL